MKNLIKNSDGFLYGWGLFETMLCRTGKILFLDEHLTRLFTSGKKIGMRITQSRKELKTALIKTINTTRLMRAKNIYLRLNVWKVGKASDFSVIARIYTPPSYIQYQNGFKNTLSPFILNERSPLCGIKSLNYLFFALAKEVAQKAGYDEAIFLNSRGELTEGTRSNIFLVKGGNVFTPTLDCGILPGIIRAEVLKICKKNGISCRETKLTMQNLRYADEAFLTNSLWGIMPVRFCQKKSFATTRPITNTIFSLYQKIISQ